MIAIIIFQAEQKMTFVFTQSTSEMTHIIKHETFILVHPPSQKRQFSSNSIVENISSKNVLELPQNQTSIIKNIPHFDRQGPIEAFSSFQSKSEADQEYMQNESISSKKRANKFDMLKDIDESHVDNGRGGNCVASNICKTLVRIVLSHLYGGRLQNFNSLLRRYQVKSQKENSVIIMLLLHTYGKQQRLSIQMYGHIVSQFHHSLKESENNCERKMRDQELRKSFHGKNRRMYRMFARINREIYEKSVANLTADQTWNIKELEQLVSNSYDRKQRQVEKAMNKVKSIILNHTELKQWFDFWHIDIEQVFFESVDFAFRRNLPKRCKQIKETAKSIIHTIKAGRAIQTDEDKYMMCYMTLTLMGEKVKQIWDEFVTSLYMKQEYNQRQQERQKLRFLLEKDIPKRFQEQILKQTESMKQEQKVLNSENQIEKQNTFLVEQNREKMRTNDNESKCKVEYETNQGDSNKYVVAKKNKPFSEIYRQIRQSIEF